MQPSLADTTNAKPRFAGVALRAAIVVMVWTVLATISAHFNYLAKLGTNFQIGRDSWWDTFLFYAPNWYTWALFTPFIYAISRTVRRTSMPPLRWLLIQLALSAGFAVLFSSIVVPLRIWILSAWGARFEGDILEQIKKSLLFRVHFDAMIYWGILAVFTAREYRIRLRAQEARSIRLGDQLVAAKLDALRAQIHPHFLFNTLNSIATLMRINETPRALEMLGSLSDLLRRTLHSSMRTWIPLSEELELVEQYLAIEQTRFQDRLKASLDVDPRTVDIHIPAFILQPIVENCVRYGIGPNPKPGRIDIVTRLELDRLRIEVSNTGIPSAKRDESSNGQGMGLRNIEQRLREAYGERASVRLDVATDGFAVARLLLPIETNGPVSP